MISDNDKILVGLSGGPDSVFLLNVLLKLKSEYNIEVAAAHINHMIRGADADNDELFCEDICKNAGIEFYKISLNIPEISRQHKISEENAGRIERYKFFNKICDDYGYNKIAVAHNMNDSVETILLNLIRGCSLNGLTGIKPINNNIIRPILNVKKSKIIEYLDYYNIKYCIDNTNHENLYTRNKVRNVILESMKEINPSVVETIIANADNIRNYDDYIKTQCENLNCIQSKDGTIIIDNEILKKQHISIRKRVIYDALCNISGSSNNIENKHIDILTDNLTSGKKYHLPNGVLAEISFNKIILRPNNDKININCQYKIYVNPPCVVTIENSGEYSFDFVSKVDFSDKSSIYINYDDLANETLFLRNRKDGDFIIPYGMKGKKKLKQLYMELKIPAYKRDFIPLLCSEHSIIAVVPYRICDKHKITDTTKTILRVQKTKEN